MKDVYNGAKPGIFQNLRQAVLFITFGLIFWIVLAVAVFAQSTSGAVSGSVANNKNINASGAISSGNAINFYGEPARTRDIVEYDGSYRIENVPQVSAPGFSSGHPCAYAPLSGGIGVVGGGASLGGQRIDDACLLAQMGFTREAMAMIAARNPAAMVALRAGGKIVSAPKATASSKTSQSARAPSSSGTLQRSPFTKCSYDPGSNKLTFKARAGVDRGVALAACKTAAGF